MEAIVALVVEAIKHFFLGLLWEHFAQFAAGFTVAIISIYLFNKWKKGRQMDGGVTPVALQTMAGGIDDEALRSLGIRACVRTLKDSKWEPDKCRNRTNKNLRMSGIMGAKWVDSEADIERFRRCLKRIEAERGVVQFLIVNPYGRAIEQIVKLRDDVGVRHYQNILQRHIRLMEEFACFKVRLFDYVPYFRIVIVDNREMAVSRYRIWDGREAGWQAPHLILHQDENPLEPEANSLFYAFERHFNHVWESLSVPAEDAIRDAGRGSATQEMR